MIMSCNGCRVLRKGCTHNCLLRQSLTSFHSPLAQSNATLFVSKFFGRSPLLSFLSSVAPHLRPVMFQSLLYEACGRTINPVTGAVGLMYTGNWTLCQTAVDTVLRGGKPTPLTGFLDGQTSNSAENNASEGEVVSVSVTNKKRKYVDHIDNATGPVDLDLRLMTTVTPTLKRGRTVSCGSDESGTTSFDSGDEDGHELEGITAEGKALSLFC